MSLPTGSTVIKDPSATQWAKGIDWTDYCAERSTTISSSTWAIAGPDSNLTVVTSSIVTGSLKTQLKLSGGTVGARYTVTNAITTAVGGVDHRSFIVLVQDR
jgi:hypothetical protein